MIATLKRTGMLLAIGAVAFACSPEVGSKEWCKAMKEKPRGDWTLIDARDFAQHCVL